MDGVFINKLILMSFVDCHGCVWKSMHVSGKPLDISFTHLILNSFVFYSIQWGRSWGTKYDNGNNGQSYCLKESLTY